MSRHLLERLPKKHLIIHMDINKTIIQVDLAGGRTMEDVLNSNAGANVYGFVDKCGNWKPLYGPHEAKHSTEGKGEILSYEEYIDRIHCEPPEMQELPKAEKDAMWKTISDRRRQASGKFTLPGEIGEQYAHLVTEQLKCLQVGTGKGYHVIIPSFFKLMNTLSELQWPFTLIFRTFGSDLASVLREWNQFVRGEHVCTPSGSILEGLRANFIEPQTGCVYREKDDLYLCYGPSVSASHRAEALMKLDKSPPHAILEELRTLPGCTAVKKTTYSQLNEDLLSFYEQSNNVGGLVDYYPFWAQGAERRSCGKVFPVSLSDPSAQSHYSVFFDDNIAFGNNKSIVDIRDVRTNESIVGKEVEQPFCVCVNTYDAIVNEDYFVEQLYECIKRQQGDK